MVQISINGENNTSFDDDVVEGKGDNALEEDDDGDNGKGISMSVEGDDDAIEMVIF